MQDDENNHLPVSQAEGEYPPIVIEKPDGLVKRKASLYCMMGGVLDYHLEFEALQKRPFFPPGAKDPSWRSSNTDRFEPIDLPSVFGEHWRHRKLNCDINEFEPYIRDLRIINDALIPHIPDICPHYPFVMVSDRAKNMLESIDPSGSYFFPQRIYSQVGVEVNAKIWCWVLRNRIFYNNPDLETPRLMVPFTGPFSDSQMIWEIKNIPGIRDYLLGISFFSSGIDFLFPAFNKEVFYKLRAAKFTGLVENTESNFASQRKIHESIGHIE